MKKVMMGLALLAAGLAQGAALDGGTVYAWRGEKDVVWFDATNRRFRPDNYLYNAVPAIYYPARPQLFECIFLYFGSVFHFQPQTCGTRIQR